MEIINKNIYLLKLPVDVFFYHNWLLKGDSEKQEGKRKEVLW